METTIEPRTSYILNTFCLDPVVRSRISPMTGQSYAEREEMVEEAIDAAIEEGFDEVIVVGAFRPDPSRYHYLPHPPIFRSRADALWLREFGARNSTGSILVFGHDDHKVAPDFLPTLRTLWPFDLVVPARENRDGLPLNNGEADGYMGGHVLAMSRELWAKVPWTSVESEWWDVPLSRLWREHDAEITFSSELRHIDLEV